MGFDIPYGDPSGMREYARRLRSHADSLEHVLASLDLPGSTDFRGRVADSFRVRRDETRQMGRQQRDGLYDLAGWLDARAADLERQIDEARRRAQEAERRRQMTQFPWPSGR